MATAAVELQALGWGVGGDQDHCAQDTVIQRTRTSLASMHMTKCTCSIIRGHVRLCKVTVLAASSCAVQAGHQFTGRLLVWSASLAYLQKHSWPSSPTSPKDRLSALMSPSLPAQTNPKGPVSASKSMAPQTSPKDRLSDWPLMPPQTNAKDPDILTGLAPGHQPPGVCRSSAPSTSRPAPKCNGGEAPGHWNTSNGYKTPAQEGQEIDSQQSRR